MTFGSNSNNLTCSPVNYRPHTVENRQPFILKCICLLLLFQVMKHRKATMEFTPMTFVTAEMKPGAEGRFLISCQIHAHRTGKRGPFTWMFLPHMSWKWFCWGPCADGMRAMFKVEKCPGPDLRNVKKENYEEYGEDYFNTINLQPMRPRAHGGTSRSQRSKIWKHYIAAEELMWDYAPHLTNRNR